MSKISTPGERPSYISYITPNIPDRTEQKCKSNAIPPIPHARKPQTYNQGSRLQGTKQQHSIEGHTKPPEEPYKPNMPNTETTDPYKSPEAIRAWTEKQGPTHDLYSDPRSAKKSDRCMCR